MERIRAKVASNEALFHPVTKVVGSKNHPISFDDSDDDSGPSRPVVPGAMPLTIDSANTHRMSKPAKKEFIKMPVPHPAPAPPHMPNTAENNPAGVATPKFVKDDGNGEAFALEGAEFVENPYERRKNQTETQKELVDLVQSAMDADLEVDMELAVVEGFSPKFTLLPHQVKGRIWMAERETGKKAGGILGDMGLGKTCQTICRIVDFKLSDNPAIIPEKKKWGKTTLIVCPPALVGQWQSEIRKMAPLLRVSIHHESTRTKIASDFTLYDVIITTYNVVLSEHKNLLELAKDETADPEDVDDEDALDAAIRRRVSDKPKRKRVTKKHTALFDGKFLRIVLDEAHNIKNRVSKTTLGCWALKARYRWCLTGTPIQNGVEELYPFMHFLQIRPLNEWDTFNSQIVKPIKAGRSQIPMKRLQVVLSAIMLRRKKTDEINGKPILVLPDRNVAIVECQFDEDEMAFYTAMVERTEVTLNKFKKSGASNVFTSVLVLLLRLRQACCHPELTMKNAKEDAEAINPKDKDPEKTEVEEADDELADMMGGLGLKESKCEICQDILTPGIKSKYCVDCELSVIVKARRKSTAGRRGDDDYAPVTLPSSAKIRKLLEILEQIDRDSEGTDKTIVFSQFTSFLDIIQKFLDKDGFKYIRYDGSMKREEREDALTKFRTSKSRNIALISFKAGSTGLNLTAANHVVLMDLWWNPALEDQAFDRAHRFGQKKDVFIHKLVIPLTVEEKIQALQDKKRELATNALTGAKLGKRSGLGMNELLELFSHEHN